MAEHDILLIVGSFLEGEDLKLDGSNFIEWYKRLFKMLNDNNSFDLIYASLEDEPDDPDDMEKYLDHQATSIYIKSIMRQCMVPELGNQYRGHVYADSVMQDLVERFDEQWRLGQFEYFDKFLSTKMEENTDVEAHLNLMEDIHEFLTEGLDHWVPTDHAVSVLLRSLPPSYASFVDGYIRKGYWATFNQVQEQIRDLKVEPMAGEIIEGQGPAAEVGHDGESMEH